MFRKHFSAPRRTGVFFFCILRRETRQQFMLYDDADHGHVLDMHNYFRRIMYTRILKHLLPWLSRRQNETAKANKKKTSSNDNSNKQTRASVCR